MVPTLKIPKGALMDNGFINAYVSDAGRDVQYENCIYLLFKPDDIDAFREFLDSEYERTSSIIDDYDEDGFVIVVYQLNKEYIRDYELVKQGKYSKTSKQFQNEFPKKLKVMIDGSPKEETTLQIRVFRKTHDLIEFWENMLGVRLGKDQELWHEFDLEKETLYIKKIKENFNQLNV